MLHSSSSSQQLQRSVQHIPAFLCWQRMVAHLSFQHLHDLTSWIMASGAGERVVITGAHSFSSSFHSQPKYLGDGKVGFATQSLFHTNNWLRAAGVGGSRSDLTWFFLKSHHRRLLTLLMVVFGRKNWHRSFSTALFVSALRRCPKPGGGLCTWSVEGWGCDRGP